VFQFFGPPCIRQPNIWEFVNFTVTFRVRFNVFPVYHHRPELLDLQSGRYQWWRQGSPRQGVIVPDRGAEVSAGSTLPCKLPPPYFVALHIL